jgi:AI-2 transport system substrate-binding protein
MQKLFCLPALFLAVLLTWGCGPEEPDPGDKTGDITVVFIPKLTGNAFFEAANQGAQAYAAEQGFKVDYRGSPEAEAARQAALVEEAVSAGVSAISISALDAGVLDRPLKAALAAGVKVVTWDSDVAPDTRQLMVSQGTPEQLGRMLVEMGAKSLDSRGRNPCVDRIKYVWHYSQARVTDQNSWHQAGERYIRETYPDWENVAPDNYYSEQNAELAAAVGETIFRDHPDVDLIICNDSTALPGQAQAAASLGLSAREVTITGFASPKAMRAYCLDGVVERWGLWDCGIQGALSCYLAYYLASGHDLKVGDRVDAPNIGLVEIMPNSVLDPAAPHSESSGVVLLPERLEFTIDNVDYYDY